MTSNKASRIQSTEAHQLPGKTCKRRSNGDEGVFLINRMIEHENASVTEANAAEGHLIGVDGIVDRWVMKRDFQI